jgi:hypothetical protein
MASIHACVGVWPAGGADTAPVAGEKDKVARPRGCALIEVTISRFTTRETMPLTASVLGRVSVRREVRAFAGGRAAPHDVEASVR